MMMHVTNKGRIYLTTDTEHWLTNDITYTPGPVYLGKFDVSGNWRDVETPEGYEWRQNEDAIWELIPIKSEEDELNENDQY